mmetsp:Transcript_55833/g.122314  ORF Transcript_55833/g.122314 Transcript_55833/m.122314 type:complete len:373 (+) Transcript_55833:100-1218(+)
MIGEHRAPPGNLVHFALGQEARGGGHSAHGAEPELHKLALRLGLIVSSQAIIIASHHSRLGLDGDDPLLASDIGWLASLDNRRGLDHGMQSRQQRWGGHRHRCRRWRRCWRLLLLGRAAPPASVARPALFTSGHRALGPLSYHLPVKAAGVLQYNLLLQSRDDTFGGTGGVTEAHKSVAPGAMGDAIPHQVDTFDNPEASKLTLDVLLRCLPGEIGNQQSSLGSAGRGLQSLVQAGALSPAKTSRAGRRQRRSLGHGRVRSGGSNTGVQQSAEVHGIGQRRRGDLTCSGLVGHRPNLRLRLGHLSLRLRGQPLLLELLGALYLLHVPHQLGKIGGGPQTTHLQPHGPHARGLRVHVAHAQHGGHSSHHPTVK